MAVVWSMKLFKADAGKVYEELETIKDRTPQNIVDYAEANPESELYKCFTWDDRKAANEWRKYEARQVVRLLVFEDEETNEPTRIRVMQRASETYEPVKKIVRDENEYKKLLNRAYAELQIFRDRYKNLVELEGILEAIDALI